MVPVGNKVKRFSSVNHTTKTIQFVHKKLHNRLLDQGLCMINFPDYEYFNDVDIAYSNFVKRITPFINKVASFMDIRIKNYSRDWFHGKILDKIIVRDERLKKFKASRLDLMLMNSCIKKQN